MKEKDRSTPDLKRLRELAMAAEHSGFTPKDDVAEKWIEFRDAANPQTLLSLIDRIERLEGALRHVREDIECDGRTPDENVYKHIYATVREALRE